MRPLIATVAVFGAALAVPAVRHRVVHLLARAGRGTNVHVVPTPRSR